MIINLLKNKWSCTKLIGGGGTGGSKNRILGQTPLQIIETASYQQDFLKICPTWRIDKVLAVKNLRSKTNSGNFFLNALYK